MNQPPRSNVAPAPHAAGDNLFPQNKRSHHPQQQPPLGTPFAPPQQRQQAPPQQQPPLGTPFAPPQQRPQQVPPQTASQQETIASSGDDTPKQSKSSGFSKPVAIAVCLLVIVAAIIGLIVFFFFRSKKQDPPEPTEEEKKKQKAERDRLAHERFELESLRKNDTILKHRLHEYENKLRYLERENSRLQQEAEPASVIERYQNEHGMPTENYYEMPEAPKSTSEKSEDEKSTKERKEDIKRMVNQKRDTVADMFEEQAQLREAKMKQNDDDSRKIIDNETNSTIFRNDDDDDDDEDPVMQSIKSGGSVVENQ